MTDSAEFAVSTCGFLIHSFSSSCSSQTWLQIIEMTCYGIFETNFCKNQVNCEMHMLFAGPMVADCGYDHELAEFVDFNIFLNKL